MTTWLYSSTEYQSQHSLLGSLNREVNLNPHTLQGLGLALQLLLDQHINVSTSNDIGILDTLYSLYSTRLLQVLQLLHSQHFNIYLYDATGITCNISFYNCHRYHL